MGSKGHLPPSHIRRPLPGLGMMHPDPFAPSIRPPPGAYPSFDMLPPPEVLEQKLAVQHVDMQRLAIENQQLAATHVALRQELAAGQQELQRLQAHVDAMKHEKEQQMRGLMDKITKMEADLQAAEAVKVELQQARADAQSLIAARQELLTKVQHLTQDHQKTHSDIQQIPALMLELEGLRQEYQRCRATYDYEKKLYNDHNESLQVMEKNYVSMAREVEKLRAELANAANLEQRTGARNNHNAGVLYGGTTGYKENEATGHHPVGQNAYGEGYNVSQGRGALPNAVSPYGGGPAGSAPARVGYDAPRGPGHDAARGAGFEAARGGYEAPRTLGYDAPPISARGPQGQVAVPGNSVPYGSATPPTLPGGGGGYDAARGAGFEAARGGYEAPRTLGYDALPRSAGGPQGQVAIPGNSVPYGSATRPTLAGGGYYAQLRGGNPVRR